MGSADGVLILDDTGFAKKGIWSAGVARQYWARWVGLITARSASF